MVTNLQRGSTFLSQSLLKAAHKSEANLKNMSDHVGLNVSIPFAIGWAVCSGINAASYLFIKSNYDTSKSVYFAHMLEARIMTIACLVLALFNMYLAFATDCEGAICCTCMITFLNIIPQVHTLITFGISLIR